MKQKSKRILFIYSDDYPWDVRLEKEAKVIEDSVNSVLDEGYRTGDIAGSHLDELKSSGKLVGTKEMGKLVVERI